jgi:hypothetical protein
MIYPNVIILTRDPEDPKTQRVYDACKDICPNTKIVSDPGRHIDGYEQMCSNHLLSDPKRTTAWDFAFFDIDDEAYTWFIEDDVAFNPLAFRRLLETTQSDQTDLFALNIFSKEKSLDWGWWKHYSYPFSDDVLYKSFNPLCRCSPSLIKSILEFRSRHGSFIFHEVLFSTLASTRVDMRKLPEFDFTQFNWRNPPVSRLGYINKSFYHPVKINSFHRLLFESA